MGTVSTEMLGTKTEIKPLLVSKVTYGNNQRSMKEFKGINPKTRVVKGRKANKLQMSFSGGSSAGDTIMVPTQETGTGTKK